MIIVNVCEGIFNVATATVLRRCFWCSYGEVKETEAGCLLNTKLRAIFPLKRPIYANHQQGGHTATFSVQLS
jgi:hypothetical protein